MTKKFLFLTVTLIMASSLLFTSCKKDPEIVDPVELITTLNYTLTPASGGAAVTLSFQDLDGDGGNAPTITSGTLAANETYTGSIEVLDESKSPVENITEEVAEEDEEHQFFFQSTVADLSVAYTDEDADGNPIGLSSTLTTGAAGTGSITVTLRHEPAKTADGVAGGDITNAGGETDVEATFSIEVQ